MFEKLNQVVAKLIKDVSSLRASIPGPVDVEEIAVAAAKLVPVAKPGKDADPVDELKIIKAVLEALPPPKHGKNADPVDTTLIADAVLSKIPKPKNGKDAPPVDINVIVRQILKKIPRGPEAKTIEADEDEIVEKVLARIPKAKDGRDGKSITNVRLSNNNLFVSIDGKEKKVGKLTPAKVKRTLGQIGVGGGPARVAAFAVEEAPKDNVQYTRRNGEWITGGYGLSFSDDRTLTGQENVSVGTLVGGDSRTIILADPATVGSDYELAIRNETDRNNVTLTVEPPVGITINGLTDPFIVLRGEYILVNKDTDTNYIAETVAQQRARAAAQNEIQVADLVTFFRSDTAFPIPTTFANFKASLIDRHVIQSLTLGQTTADIDISPQTKFDTPITLKGGNYKITLSIEAGVDSTNWSIATEFYIDDVLQDSRWVKEPKDVTDILSPSKVIFINLSQGEHDFRLMYGRSGGPGTAVVSLANVRVFIEDF